MTEFKLINNNTEKHAPENPMVTYEIIADMGKDGTKTIFSSDNYSKVYNAMNEITKGNLSVPELDLYEDELENVVGMSVVVVLTAKNLDIIRFDGETSASAEIMTYEVK